MQTELSSPQCHAPWQVSNPTVLLVPGWVRSLRCVPRPRAGAQGMTHSSAPLVLDELRQLHKSLLGDKSPLGRSHIIPLGSQTLGSRGYWADQGHRRAIGQVVQPTVCQPCSGVGMRESPELQGAFLLLEVVSIQECCMPRATILCITYPL